MDIPITPGLILEILGNFEFFLIFCGGVEAADIFRFFPKLGFQKCHIHLFFTVFGCFSNFSLSVSFFTGSASKMLYFGISGRFY